MRGLIPMGEIQSRSFEVSECASSRAGSQDSQVRSREGRMLERQHANWSGLLTWPLILARQRASWSPFVIAGELWRLLTHIGKLREILRLLKLRPLDELYERSPRLAFKFVASNYLARGFTVIERASCFLHHYRRMHSALPESTLRQILHGYVTLHEFDQGGNRFALTMDLPEQIGDCEGELSLDLRVNGKKVFNLSFTIIPGWVVKSEATEILLITRLQGMFGSGSQIRLARKAYHEFSPGKLLIAALQGIADAFGISELEAVSATNQRSYREEGAALFKKRYDGFFANLGMSATPAGFYSGRIPIEGRPLASFRGRNRSQARKRRSMRQQIRAACADFLLEITCRAADSASSTCCLAQIPAVVESWPSPVSFSRPDYNRNLEPGDYHNS